MSRTLSPAYQAVTPDGRRYDVKHLGGTWRAIRPDGTLFAMYGHKEDLEHALRAEVRPAGEPVARNTDPATSHDAAASASTRRALCLEQVRTILAQHPEGMTLEGLVGLHNAAGVVRGFARFSESGVRTRCAELVRAGDVVDTGRREKMTSGRRAIVWALAR